MLVWQKGVGNELFGFPQVDVIQAWLPVMMFAILFGLSMDYQVFLISRIRERYHLFLSRASPTDMEQEEVADSLVPELGDLLGYFWGVPPSKASSRACAGRLAEFQAL